MKTELKSAIVILFTVLAIAPIWAATLSATDKAFLASYEKIRSALAADDLTLARKAAASLGEQGAGIAKSQSLDDARASFTRPSKKAEQLAATQPGYYIIYCPMAKGDWVQTSTHCISLATQIRAIR